MPQKKNADSLELIRGKTGRLIGHVSYFYTSIELSLSTLVNRISHCLERATKFLQQRSSGQSSLERSSFNHKELSLSGRQGAPFRCCGYHERFDGRH